ncbi:LysM peptidoglycan-binding domain-containing protein [Actinomyces sp. W5033]|uniref:LysM peptidoglycan-binding domain-containing protein n=1 Tax=Actinomyces sp. W5033 TaxID=3446479 RepID=UPI003EE04746
MSTTTRLGLVTTLSVLVAAALASRTAAAVIAVIALPPHLWGVGHVDDLLVLLLGATGTAGALWHAVSGVLALAVTGTGPGRQADGAAARLLSRWGAPYVRRLAAGALAAALVLPGTALAQEGALPPDDLGWAPTVSADAQPGDDGALAEPATEPGRTALSAPAAAGAESSRSYVVQEGDSLWTITSRVLERTDPAEVAEAWPELYLANDDVIGEDPGLIHPGTVLDLPSPLTGLS